MPEAVKWIFRPVGMTRLGYAEIAPFLEMTI